VSIPSSQAVLGTYTFACFSGGLRAASIGILAGKLTSRSQAVFKLLLRIGLVLMVTFLPSFMHTVLAGEVISPAREPSKGVPSTTSSEVSGRISPLKLTRVSVLSFSKGYISALAPAGEDGVIFLSTTPTGSSLYRAKMGEERVVEVASEEYLSGVLGKDFAFESALVKLSSDEKVVMILAKGSRKLTLLDISVSPKIIRYSVKLPGGFSIDGAGFLDSDNVFIYSKTYSAFTQRHPILIFSLTEKKLSSLKVDYGQAVIIKDLLPISAHKLLLLAYFGKGDKPFRSALASLEPDSKRIDFLEVSEVSSISADQSTIAIIRRIGKLDEERADGGDTSSAIAKYQLELYSDDFERLPGTLSVPIYGEPEFIAVLAEARAVLLISGKKDGRKNLWLIDMLNRSKRLVEDDVRMVVSLADGKSFCVVKERDNTLHFYSVSSE